MKIFRIIKSMQWYHYALFGLVILGAISAIAYSASSNNVNDAETESKTYEFKELGRLCDEGGPKIKEFAEEYKTVVKQGYDESLKDIDSLQAELSATPTYYAQTDMQNNVNRLRTENVERYQDGLKKYDEMLAESGKLDACASYARAKKQFTATEAAEFQAIIAKYKK